MGKAAWISPAGRLLVCCLAALSGCERSTAVPVQRAAATAPLQVIATVAMVADLVRNVGGPHVQVTQLMGPGVDPHLYKVTRDDVRAIFAGDVIFYSGLMLEGKMTHTLEQMALRKPVISVTAGLPADRLLGAGDGGGHGDEQHADPHVWMDVALWAETLPVICETLITLVPEHAEEFRANAQRYQQALQRLHRYGLEAIDTIPPLRRQLITSHDAFGYFGRAYGLEVHGVQGLSTDSEAGLMRINQLVDLIVRRQVAAVFVESSVPRKSLEAVIEGAGARGHRVVIGGELYSDSGGTEGTYEGTYLGMMDHNFTQVARALGGTAPLRGLNGQLSVQAQAEVSVQAEEVKR